MSSSRGCRGRGRLGWGGVWGYVVLSHNGGARPVPAPASGSASITLIRVVVLRGGVATLIWVPVGVKIGMSPRLARYAQPIVQVLASFPAIFLFPFAIVVFLVASASASTSAASC